MEALRPSRRRRGLLSLCLLCALGACVVTKAQHSAIDDFAKSTQLYAHVVSLIASQVQDDVDALRERGLGLPTPESNKDFQTQRTKGLYDYIHNLKAREHVALMDGLASSLEAYGDVLEEFADYGSPDERSKTFVDIADQMDAALHTPVAKAEADAIGQGLAFIASQVLEAVKKKDIKAIVIAYQPAVSAAAKLLESEFQGEQPGTLFFEYKYAITLFANRLPDLQSSTLGNGATVAAAQIRSEMVADERFLGDQRAHYETVRTSGIDASKALSRANDRLAAALEDDSLTPDDISDFARRAKSLYDSFKGLSSSSSKPAAPPRR